MGLIPIPQEVETVKPREIILETRKKIRSYKDSRAFKILEKTTTKISEYIDNERSFNANTLDSLIDDMHRSIIILQNKKLQELKKSTKRRRNRV